MNHESIRDGESFRVGPRIHHEGAAIARPPRVRVIGSQRWISIEPCTRHALESRRPFGHSRRHLDRMDRDARGTKKPATPGGGRGHVVEAWAGRPSIGRSVVGRSVDRAFGPGNHVGRVATSCCWSWKDRSVRRTAGRTGRAPPGRRMPTTFGAGRWEPRIARTVRMMSIWRIIVPWLLSLIVSLFVSQVACLTVCQAVRPDSGRVAVDRETCTLHGRPEPLPTSRGIYLDRRPGQVV